jgi:phosphate-selective porin OprO and OprP
MMKRAVVIIFLLYFCITGKNGYFTTQSATDDKLTINFDDGIGFHSPDSTYGLNFRFLIQNRLGFTSLSGNDLTVHEIDARIRRLRLRMEGFTGNHISYTMQLSFSRSDMDADNSVVPHIILDAMIYYSPVEKLKIGFGQEKLPGNRQRLNSSGQLQFTDRSITNEYFNIDRDFGIISNYTSDISGIHYKIKTAVSSGKGKNSLSYSNGLAFTARFELLPLGRFSGDGDFSEGDLQREPDLKLSLAGSFHYNHNAIKTRGQRGDLLYEPRNLESAFLDVMVKYRGWAALAEYMDRSTSDPVTRSPDNEIMFVKTGYGINGQLSYLFKNDLEVAGRYSVVRPELQGFDNEPGQPTETLVPDPLVKEYALGVTRYIINHKVKAQGNLGYRKSKPAGTINSHQANWFLQFQVEVGI